MPSSTTTIIVSVVVLCGCFPSSVVASVIRLEGPRCRRRHPAGKEIAHGALGECFVWSAAMQGDGVKMKTMCPEGWLLRPLYLIYRYFSGFFQTKQLNFKCKRKNYNIRSEPFKIFVYKRVSNISEYIK